MPSECPQSVTVQVLSQLLQEKAEDLVGKVMSQLEASVPVEKQCNAMKMIVKKHIYDAFNGVLEKISSYER